MHTENIVPWRHTHRCESSQESAAERRARIVVGLTAVTTAAEISAGTCFNSMALLADGWHMSTHACALGITAYAYGYARRHADDGRFAFGTGKVGVLAAFTSAVILGMIGLTMAWESASRLSSMQTIAFDQALAVALLGLAVNIISALILAGRGHGHTHEHHSHDHRHDYNLMAAYLHVISDAFSSLLAIVALLLGKFLGWWWMDPAVGLVGSIAIAKWAWGMMSNSGKMLIDHSQDQALNREVRSQIEKDADNRLADLHLWQIGPGRWAAIISVVTAQQREPAHYKALLANLPEIGHLTIEVLPCLAGEEGEAKRSSSSILA